MPSWPEQRTYIGGHTTRIDGPLKVTGAAKYPSDVQPEGWLYGMILRSKWPKAKISGINLDKARAVPGIKAAVLAREGERTVRYYGEELAAVAGTSKQACLDALRLIEVEAKPLPFVVREEDAKEESSPRVWEDTPNVSKR
jgi:CO/xanthine dehydrogenase Mo-binding subunit